MGQARFDAQNKAISIPQWLIFSKKIPLSEIKSKTEKMESTGGSKIFRVLVSGDFGEQELIFNNYEDYATFIYQYQQAMLAA